MHFKFDFNTANVVLLFEEEEKEKEEGEEEQFESCNFELVSG